MKKKLLEVKEKALRSLSEVNDLKQLDDARIRILGKKGELTGLMKGMGKLSKEERPVIGQLANEVRSAIETELEKARKNLEERALSHRLNNEKIDVTMPGRVQKMGHRHPMSIVIDDIKNIFIGII